MTDHECSQDPKKYPDVKKIPRLPFLHTQHLVFAVIRGKAPTDFERATAVSLWDAYEAAAYGELPGECSHDPKKYPDVGKIRFQAVSAATGSGKTLGAYALFVHLSPAPVALVLSTIEQCEKAFRDLSRLLPGKVAVYTSAHKAENQNRQSERALGDKGLSVTGRFTESELRAAQVAIVTHDRWKREVREGGDLGVRKCSGIDRALVVVDEEPDLERTFIAQPHHVADLADALTDGERREDARAFGFVASHPAAVALRGIGQRMAAIKDEAAPGLQGAELVSADDAALLQTISYQELLDRLSHLPPLQRSEAADMHNATLDFLKAAAQGRVFYSRTGRGAGAFHAYAYMLPPQPRTVILDGTADLNGMYAVGSGVTVASAIRPNYADLQLHLVNPPRAFRGQLRPEGLLRYSWTAAPFVDWFLSFLVDNTSEGERVLVHAKESLLAYGLHKDAKRDESGVADPFYSELKGRRIYWCHFGRGRGMNDWQHCTANFRIGGWYLPKAVMLSKIGSRTGRRYSAGDLRKFSGRTAAATDDMLTLAVESHVLTHTKQDAARICIRHLDDTGRCPAARVYMVDADKPLMVANRERLFPGAGDWRLIDCEPGEAAEGTAKARRDGTSLLADLLLTADSPLTADVIEERTGIRSNNIEQSMASAKVAPVATSRGWFKTTRKAVGMSGKGYVLALRPITAA